MTQVPLPKAWKELSADINWREYGGKWYRVLSYNSYHVIELINMWEATGDNDQPQYAVQLCEIDVESTRLGEALDCIGAEIDPRMTNDQIIWISLDALSSYGACAPMGGWSGNNVRELFRQANRESFQLMSDSDYHKSQMDRSVNRLGSTAREYMNGDTNSALIRGIAKGDITARIMGKIHGLTVEEMDQVGPEYSDFTMTPE